MTEKNRETLEKANAAVAVSDYEKFLTFCSEDTDWTFVGDRILKGKEAVRQWMMAEYKTEPPVNNVINLIAEGDFVTAVGNISTKDKDGKTVHSAYCDVWRFRGGKMVELKAFVIAADSEQEAGDAVFDTSFVEVV